MSGDGGYWQPYFIWKLQKVSLRKLGLGFWRKLAFEVDHIPTDANQTLSSLSHCHHFKFIYFHPAGWKFWWYFCFLSPPQVLSPGLGIVRIISAVPRTALFSTQSLDVVFAVSLKFPSLFSHKPCPGLCLLALWQVGWAVVVIMSVRTQGILAVSFSSTLCCVSTSTQMVVLCSSTN